VLHPDLSERAAEQDLGHRRVAGLMDRSGEALFRSSLGISLAQFLVLSVVDAHPGPLNQQAVADRLGLTKGTVSRQIDAAVAAGLMTVEVSPESRREHLVDLTAKGTRLVRRGDRLVDREQRIAMPQVSAADLAATLPGSPSGQRSPRHLTFPASNRRSRKGAQSAR
jgi:DNA-binding MarR family transcriptional regulator